jgi:hypothetical protein
LAIGTLGFWVPCWIITLIAARWEPWRCTDCGRPQVAETPEAHVPELASTEAVGSPGFGLVHEHAE